VVQSTPVFIESFFSTLLPRFVDWKCYGEDDFLFALADKLDILATITSKTRTRISRVVGWNSTEVIWSSNKTFTDYQFRVVSAASDPVTSGVQIELNQNPSAGGSAATEYTSTLTDNEIEAVSPAEGDKIVKLFVNNSSGWST
jgi:hypothetical protein